MKFTFRYATPKDDPEIRELLRTVPVPGAVPVTYEREPNYFLGCGVMGQTCQVLISRHTASGKLAGIACRAIRPMYVNSEVRQIAYLSQLRVHPQFQGYWITSKGFRFLRQVHDDHPAEGQLTTIIEGNRLAKSVLVDKPRRHFPVYRWWDRFCVLAIVVTQFRKDFKTYQDFENSVPTASDLPEIIAFLNKHGAKRQFFPVYTTSDFAESPLTRDFQPADFRLVRRQGQIAGVMGYWDQSQFKQTVVQGYTGMLRGLRPFYNAIMPFVGHPRLPEVGKPIRYSYASFWAVKEEDPTIFDHLLRAIVALAAERHQAYVMIGLSTRDPLFALARKWRHIPYYSHLYTVTWNDGAPFHEQLDSRPPYLDIAAY
ncbi:MAG: hypothetical protein D6675_14770 [Gemmatimonadetes bacterium]|nr:MAG: hypothetical protein D6675_14770 [Gemmatimonadota bacterium]